MKKKRNDISLVAICNDDIQAISKNIKINIGDVSVDNVDFSKYSLYTDYKQMIEKEELDFVFVTLPSFLHSEVCTYCLEHGLDVYTEKPMAVTMEQCDKMMAAARKSGKKLMVGHCLRFSDEYIYLKKLIESGEYGKPVKAEFTRKSPLPTWSAGGWLLDDSKSGGCIVDMHIHDVDAMVWLFGVPENYVSHTTNSRADYESAFALYKYPDFVVSIIGDWGLPTTYKFKYTYSVTFEKAYVECVGGQVTIYTDEGCEEMHFDSKKSMYYKEELEFIEAVVDGKPFETADVNSVYETMKIIFDEKER